MSKLFGTDGVRGVANQLLTPELAFGIGYSAGLWLSSQSNLPKRILVGRDTRKSGSMLGAALASGFCSAGIDVVSVGICPTGGISYLVRTGDFALGAVISASHNPAPDNGIKLMNSEGEKISAELEAFIESYLSQLPEERPVGGEIGEIISQGELKEDYLNWLISLVPERLEGMKICLDAAHGAGYDLGVECFRKLGAEVITINTVPNGVNINVKGGATHPSVIQELTKKENADLGVAYDGDADRAVFSDSDAKLINGDWMMALWFEYWSQEAKIDPPVVVGTVMSNGGFEEYLNSNGIQLNRTKVGDKYVSAELAKIGGKIGGEQSGHIIIPKHGPTGDGLVTALELARVLKREGKSAKEMTANCHNWPQILVNVQVNNKDGWEENSKILGAIQVAEEKLSDSGRINVRASGTQPMIRVMVEASEESVRDSACEKVVHTLLSQLGGTIYSRVDLTHALGD